MNENPIWTKDSMLSDRSLFLPLLISFGNLILFILFIANLYYINLNGLQTGEIRYAGFLQMYYFVAIGLFLFLLLLAPAITVSGMSMEEDEHMLELLLETDLDSRSIIFGKLYSELSTLGTFLLSTLPFLATVFIYGGIPYTYLFLYFTFYAPWELPAPVLPKTVSMRPFWRMESVFCFMRHCFTGFMPCKIRDILFMLSYCSCFF